MTEGRHGWSAGACPREGWGRTVTGEGAGWVLVGGLGPGFRREDGEGLWVSVAWTGGGVDGPPEPALAKVGADHDEWVGGVGENIP